MPMKPWGERVKALLSRVLFWLPGSVEIEEQSPDTLHDHALVMAVVAPQPVPRWKQMRYAMRVFSHRERQVIATCGLAALVAIGIAGAWYFKESTAVVPAVGGGFAEALTGQPKFLNPIDAVANDIDRDLVRLLYSGLFRYDGMTPVPDLAESYAWSDDDKVLRVTLRADARFHDGKPVTAEDARFTYESVLDPARKSPMLPMYRGMRIETDGDRTITFRLEHPDVNLLHKLTLGILPSHLWGDVPVAHARLSDLNVKPIGSGPYRVRSFTRETSGTLRTYVLERFEQYYGSKPYLTTLTFQFYPDKPSAIEAFRTDQVDAVAFAAVAEAGKAAVSSRTRHVRLELPEETVAFFNLKHPVLASKDVRKALLLAVDRSELVEALDKDAEAVHGPFPFGDATGTAPDIEAARNALTQAGWTLPQGESVRTKQAKSATDTIQTLDMVISVPDEPDLVAMAEALKRRWSLLGVRVRVEAAQLDDVVRRAVRDRNVSMVTLLNVYLGPEQDIFPFWWSGQAVERGLNFSALADRSLDAVLERLRSATSTDALADARHEASALITDSAAAAFLVRPVYAYLVAADIRGVPERMALAAPAERFQSITGWYRRTVFSWK